MARSNEAAVMKRSTRLPVWVVLVLLVLPIGLAQATTKVLAARWGHAATYLSSPPTILIQGGKTDPSNSYSYTSAINTNSLLAIPLSSSFSASSPPIQELSTDSPSYAWHCLMLFGDDQLLSFGGDGGPALAVQTNADSAWLLSPEITSSGLTNLSSSQQATGWASQPVRRIQHSCASSIKSDKSFITGGVRNDGSQMAYTDVYSFDNSTFQELPSLPVALYHHSSMLLPNGTLLVLGGISIAGSETTLASLDSVWTLDTTASAAVWQTIAIPGPAPAARRGFTTSLSANGTAAVLVGGALRDLTEPFSDTWRLELGDSWGWKQVSDGGQPRFDHAAVSIGNDQVMLVGGYGASGPADATFEIFSFATNGYVNAFTPAAQASQPDTQTPVQGTSPSQGAGAGQSGDSQSDAGNDESGASNGKADSQDGASKPTDSTPPPPPATEPPTEGKDAGHLTLPIALGTVLGLLACAAAGLGVLWYRRRMRRQRPYPSSSPRRPSRRAYASADPEKDGQGLLTFVGASHVQIQRDPAVHLGAAPRSNQVSQQSIPMLQRHLQSVKRVLSSGSREVTSAAFARRRFDMLNDEDSREFQHDHRRDTWRSAASLLESKDGDDPFKGDEHSDDDDASLIRPPIRGGPVPTPRLTSLSSQNPFEDSTVMLAQTHQQPRTGSAAEAASLLPTMQSSDPPSLNSRRSISTTSGSAVIHTAARMIPRKASFVAIKRSNTFLSRLVEGLGLLGTNSNSQRDLDIRDPTEPPELWPLESADPFGETLSLTLHDPRSDSGLSKPPTVYREMGQVPQGQSVSSLASAYTLRGMVVVQREPTNGNTDSAGGLDELEPSPVISEGPAGLTHSMPILESSERSRMTTPSTERDVGEFGLPVLLSTPPRATSSLASSHPKSPSPSPVLPHKRRPVRDIVASLNKRSDSTPTSSPPRPRPRSKTTYEAIRRSQLVVANPDDDDA